MSAFLNLSSKVNVIHLVFAKKLGLVIQFINISTQIIDGTTFETYKIVVAAFLVIDQADRVKFFLEIFLVANVSPDRVYEMSFFTLSSADVNFPKRKL